SVTEIIQLDKRERLISMQDIGSELDSVQLQAWQDLVRVLTHEIMNSITPVASLAQTAVELVEDAKVKLIKHAEVVEELKDVTEAISTIARRSDSLMKFVSDYRRLTRLPSPQKQQINLSTLFQEQNITFFAKVEPFELGVTADRDMLEQLLINLLKNAIQALTENGANTDKATVSLSAHINNRGRVTIEVADNGLGIPPDIAHNIFMPFFTTKLEGSGVGLALARHIMVAHDGTIKVGNNKNGGALFSLVF
ncbi:MAG: histidine kinase, partial [Gammaproteobacteria bacterium]|nr:histidine kinase [Gammaproteobacteria bacterium]